MLSVISKVISFLVTSYFAYCITHTELWSFATNNRTLEAKYPSVLRVQMPDGQKGISMF